MVLMNLLSLNIRVGVSESHKIDWLKRLKLENRISFGGLQESRLTAIPSELSNWWGNCDFGFDYVMMDVS